MRKLLLFFVLFSIAGVSSIHAQGTYTAADCNESSVNAVINGPTHTAVNGDTINIPSGSCTWTNSTAPYTSGIPVNVGITILGAGTANSGTGTFGAGSGLTTTIIDNGGNSTNQPLFYISGQTYGQTVTLGNLIISPLTSGTALWSPIDVIGICTASGCPQIRLTNLNLNAWTGGTGNNSTWLALVDNFFGVIDHSTWNNAVMANVNHSGWLGVGQYGDNSWAQPDSFGTANALFFENNLITGTGGTEDSDKSDTFADTGGARIVVRYNEYTAAQESISYFHGTETTGRPRGGRQMEVYGNVVTCVGNCVGVISTIRSGTGLLYDNTVTVTGAGAANGIAELYIDRTFRGPFTPWGFCDGTGGYDNNDGTTYASGTVTSSGTSTFSDSAQSWTTNQWVANPNSYSIHDVTQGFGSELSANTATAYTFLAAPLNTVNTAWTWNTSDSYEILRASICLDQPGRSGGTYLSGGTPSPTGWPSETLDPIYEWNDPVTGTYYNPGITQFINGTVKLTANRDWYAGASGIQLSPTSPFNGTNGTGWGTLANRPTTCSVRVGYWATDTNTLYLCKTTNTWTSDYTPYTYPHPLDTSGTNVVLSPSSQNFGSVNVGSSSSPVTFTVTNNSASNATSVTPTNTGGNSGDWSIGSNTCGTVTSGGGTCTFTETFTPGAGGARSTTLSVAYSGADGASPQTSALSGSGAVAGTPTFSPVGGNYATARSVTITSTPSTVICWNTTGAPATNGSTACAAGSTLYAGAITVAASETVYAVGGGTGYGDSPVGSASYVISIATVPGSRTMLSFLPWPLGTGAKAGITATIPASSYLSFWGFSQGGRFSTTLPVRVLGVNFSTSTQVYWDNAPIVTKYVSPTEVDVILTQSMVSL